jgi:hypothetical protein
MLDQTLLTLCLAWLGLIGLYLTAKEARMLLQWYAAHRHQRAMRAEAEDGPGNER